MVKPYDWTYSTAYRGTTATELQEHQDGSLVDTERLKKQEPILFYDENILYEDELADNGTAMLTIRLVRMIIYQERLETNVQFTIESNAKLLSSFTTFLFKSGRCVI